METLRVVNGIKLNKGNLMANGLFNISDEQNNVSFWFEGDTKDEFLAMSDDEFVKQAKELITDAELI